MSLPSVHAQGYAHCDHWKSRVVREIVLGWSRAFVYHGSRCCWCGARWNGERWIGGNIYEPPGEADAAVILAPPGE